MVVNIDAEEMNHLRFTDLALIADRNDSKAEMFAMLNSITTGGFKN